MNDLSQSIKHSRYALIDQWNDGILAITRVHHGIINPEKQPLFNEDRSMLIVMLGEVFDYGNLKRALLKKGHIFTRENNDGEFCLHLYEEYGKDAFIRLNGSFLILIYDLNKGELHLVTDRYSSYPVFYSVNSSGRLAFSTQVSSLLLFPSVPRNLDKEGIFEFFVLQRLSGTHTFYKDISVVPPGSILSYRDGELSQTQFWTIRFSEENHPREYYAEELAEIIKKTIGRRTRDSKRYGLLLSGGLDSRMYMAASDRIDVCLTVGDFENREVLTAKKVAAQKNCRHVFLHRKLDHYASLLDKAVDVGSGMQGFMHSHFFGFFDQIREECDVLFHGWYIERILRNSWFPKKQVKFGKYTFELSYPAKTSEEDYIDLFLERGMYSTYPLNPEQLFTRSYARDFEEIIRHSIKKEVKDVEDQGIRDVRKKLHILVLRRYPTDAHPLHIRAYMEERHIGFDNDLFDFAMKLPFELKSDDWLCVEVLKMLSPEMAHILYANTGLSPSRRGNPLFMLYYGRKVLEKFHLLASERPPIPFAQGSWPNFNQLIRLDPRLKGRLIALLEDDTWLNPDIFCRERIGEMIQEHMKGENNHTELLMLLLSFGTWFKKYGPDGDMEMC
ncbi:asparagine synthase-related protein [Acidobacteriota bacterium]